MTTVTTAPRTATAPGDEAARSNPGAARADESRAGKVAAGGVRIRGARPATRPVRRAGASGGLDPLPRRTTGRGRVPVCERSYEADLHGSRLTRRGRVVVGVVWLLFAAAIVFMVNRPAEVPMPVDTVTVTVESGDTLWGVAGAVAPGVDPRVTVDQIIELNGLRSAGDIHPGDLLLVPVAAR
jgi:LysM repeat protein